MDGWMDISVKCTLIFVQQSGLDDSSRADSSPPSPPAQVEAEKERLAALAEEGSDDDDSDDEEDEVAPCPKVDGLVPQIQQVNLRIVRQSCG